jgi:hypothetical protein
MVLQRNNEERHQVTPTGNDHRRYERFEMHLPTQVQDPDGTYGATLVDLSEGGAAILTDKPRYTNDQFIELHTEGFENLHGRVVREFTGGFALEFDDEAERQRARDEIERFKAVVGKRREF